MRRIFVVGALIHAAWLTLLVWLFVFGWRWMMHVLAANGVKGV